MAQVFVDTNALLGFYAYSSDDLAQLDKLIAEVNSKNIKMLITDHVLDEFNRNREAKIAETLKKFSEKSATDNFPRLIQHYEQYRGMRDAVDLYSKLKAEIAEQLKVDIERRTLPADRIFDQIVQASEVLIVTNDVVEAAKLRVARGNPPGKNGSLGDAINWELLVRNADRNADLHIVTQDKDYVSPIDRARISDFLADEWNSRVGSAIYLYSTLRALFEEVAPEIELSPETVAPTANTIPRGPLKLDLTKTYTRVDIVFDPEKTSPDHLQTFVEALVGTTASTSFTVGKSFVSLRFGSKLGDDVRQVIETVLHETPGVGAVNIDTESG